MFGAATKKEYEILTLQIVIALELRKKSGDGFAGEMWKVLKILQLQIQLACYQYCQKWNTRKPKTHFTLPAGSTALDLPSFVVIIMIFFRHISKILNCFYLECLAWITQPVFPSPPACPECNRLLSTCRLFRFGASLPSSENRGNVRKLVVNRQEKKIARNKYVYFILFKINEKSTFKITSSNSIMTSIICTF